MGDVANTETLDQMLSQFDIKSEDVKCLVFMRREFTPETLSSLTLQGLGLSSGSALFRVQRSASPGVTPEKRGIVDKMDIDATLTKAEEGRSKLVQAQALDKIDSALDPPAPAHPVPAPAPKTLDSILPDVAPTPAPPTPTMPDSTPNITKTTYECLQDFRNHMFDADAIKSLTILMKLVCNILSYPENPKFRQVKLDNGPIRQHLVNREGGLDLLLAMGFEKDADAPSSVLTWPSSREGEIKKLREVLELLYAEADELSMDSRPTVVKVEKGEEQEQQPTFDVFKSHMSSTQRQPKGPLETDVAVAQLKHKKSQLLATESESGGQPRKHEMVVILPVEYRNATMSSADAAAESMEESEYEESNGSDHHLILSSMKNMRATVKQREHFQTSSMREYELLKRQRVFTKVILRIQFPDRLILQATFHPQDKLSEVVQVLREAFTSEQIPSFYLFQSPPVSKLDQFHLTLTQCQLVPAALIYLSWDDDNGPLVQETLNNGPFGYLHESLFRTSSASGSYPESLSLTSTSSSSNTTFTKMKQKMKKPAWFKL